MEFDGLLPTVVLTADLAPGATPKAVSVQGAA